MERKPRNRRDFRQPRRPGTRFARKTYALAYRRGGSRAFTRARRPRYRRRLTASTAGARARLQWFRQASILAVAITAILLLLFTPGEADLPPTEALASAQNNPPAEEPANAAEEAIGAIERIWLGFYDNLPKILLAIGILLLAWILVRLIRPVIRVLLKRWERFSAAAALVSVIIWLLAIGIAFSVLAGDIRALVGSLGLIGLALSWALQTPIESFTGWLLNSFKGYYRVGDRILVGEVFGDVYRIDYLTTTVWEIGDPHRPGFVLAEQPTGRLVTFPNNEVLSGTIYNLTRDFPYVWDEMGVQIAHESDLPYAAKVFEDLARELLRTYMAEPARRYAEILTRQGLEADVPQEPQVFVSLTENWTELSIRYLVDARQRRKWKSLLSTRVNQELRNARHADRIIPVYPRRQMQLIDSDGKPTDP